MANDFATSAEAMNILSSGAAACPGCVCRNCLATIRCIIEILAGNTSMGTRAQANALELELARIAIHFTESVRRCATFWTGPSRPVSSGNFWRDDETLFKWQQFDVAAPSREQAVNRLRRHLLAASAGKSTLHAPSTVANGDAAALDANDLSYSCPDGILL